MFFQVWTNSICHSSSFCTRRLSYEIYVFQNFTSKKEREPSDCASCATRTVVTHFSHIRTNTKGVSKKRCISRRVRFHVINIDLSLQDHPDVRSEGRKRNLSSRVCRQQQGKFSLHLRKKSPLIQTSLI